MKKRVLIFALALGLMGSTQAAITGFCFTDAFGYVTSVTATKTSPGHWELAGTADVFTGTDWLVSGSYDKGTDIWTITFTNPAPDGCAFYVDAFTYTSTSYGGGTINFSWTSYCFGSPLFSGSGSTTWTQGTCPVRAGDATLVTGPAASDEAIATSATLDLKSIQGAPLFTDMFAEADLSVTKNDDNNFVIGYEMSSTSDITVEIFNHAGQHIATVVSGNQAEGFHTATWDGGNVNAGMYIAVMKSNAGTNSIKFIK